MCEKLQKQEKKPQQQQQQNIKKTSPKNYFVYLFLIYSGWFQMQSVIHFLMLDLWC